MMHKSVFAVLRYRNKKNIDTVTGLRAVKYAGRWPFLTKMCYSIGKSILIQRFLQSQKHFCIHLFDGVIHLVHRLIDVIHLVKK